MAKRTGSAGRRKQRAVMATDSEVRALDEAAAQAGMDRSSFIFQRLAVLAAGPPAWVAELVTRLDRVERTARVLYEVERQRLEANGESATWEALERRADEGLEQRARLG